MRGGRRPRRPSPPVLRSRLARQCLGQSSSSSPNPAATWPGPPQRRSRFPPALELVPGSHQSGDCFARYSCRPCHAYRAWLCGFGAFLRCIGLAADPILKAGSYRPLYSWGESLLMTAIRFHDSDRCRAAPHRDRHGAIGALPHVCVSASGVRPGRRLPSSRVPSRRSRVRRRRRDVVGNQLKLGLVAAVSNEQETAECQHRDELAVHALLKRSGGRAALDRVGDRLTLVPRDQHLGHVR
jgi:hypothetical protein